MYHENSVRLGQKGYNGLSFFKDVSTGIVLIRIRALSLNLLKSTYSVIRNNKNIINGCFEKNWQATKNKQKSLKCLKENIVSVEEDSSLL